MKRQLRPLYLNRLLHWEFWNSKWVYAPLYPYWAWLSLRARSFYFLTAANPGIKNGGFIMESKKDVYDALPVDCYPTTVYFDPGVTFSHVRSQMQRKNLTYPVILKPDIGERGLAVKKVADDDSLREYIGRMPIRFLVQDFVDYENEVGIFYWRMPGEQTGNISGIVSKHPVIVTGDGVSTVAALVKANNRYQLYYQQLQQQNEHIWDAIPIPSEKLNLMPYGNHCRGSMFLHEKEKVNAKLIGIIDRISQCVPGFYYGRFDIRFASWDDLYEGRNYAIIEINGSGSEPTHIYDPNNSIFFAWREILKHWDIMYQICRHNQRNGTKALTYTEGREQVRQFKAIERLLTSQIW